MKLWNLIKDCMLEYPNQKVCEKNAEITYEELVVFAEIFAHKLKGEKCCAILCGSEMMAAMALLSCFAAEVTAIPLSLRYGNAHCKKILDLVCPTAVITDAYGDLQVIHISKDSYIEPEEHPAIIMCTSGTTGCPKGVMLSEKNIITNVTDICAYFNINQRDSILISRPLYHCAVLTGEFLVSLLNGVEIHFYSDNFNPKALWKLIDENDISVFCGTPTLLDIMVRFKSNNSDCKLKTICISGECLDFEIGKRLAKEFYNTKIYHVYGLTEACPRVSYLPPKLFNDNPDSVGIPLDSVSIKIVKQGEIIAKKWEEGILWVKGDNVMIGYYNAPEQTEKSLKNGWLCTGDIAYIDDNSLLHIKGRSDDLIIKAGMNIYPQEIENALKKDSRVKEVYVYGFCKPKIGVQIGMNISGDFSNSDEIKELCIKVLPKYQVPSKIILLDELPKNASGKILRGN